jgi:prophage antirepressor-like protein
MSEETVVKAVEEKVEAVVEAVKEEAKSVAEAVKTEVAPEVQKTTQVISVDERLFIRELENSYLKAQMEISKLSQVTQGAQAKFTAKVEELTKKYAVDPAEWVFDNIELVFRKKQ